MKKLFVLIGLLIGWLCTSKAQTLDIDWGPFNNIEKGDNIEKLVGYDKDGYYALKTAKAGALFLEYYNGATNTIESSKEMLMPSVQGVTTEFEKIYYIGTQLILFTSAYDNNRKQRICYVQYINKDGTLNNKPKEVGSLPPSKEGKDFDFVLSDDQSKIFLTYHKTFTKYGGEPFSFKIFDATLTETFAKNVELPLKEREFFVLKYILSKGGDIYMMVKAVEESQKKTSAKTSDTGPKNYEHIVAHYNTKKDEIKTYPIEIAKNEIHSATMVINDKEEVVVMGFSGKKGSPEMTGAFYKNINPRTFKFMQVDPKSEVMLFTPDITQEFRKERNGGKDEKAETFYKYNLNQILFLKNGTAVLVAEHTYSNTQIISNPTTKTDEKFSQYFFNDILLAAADKEGAMQFIRRICKNQFSRDDDGRYGSYACAVEGNLIKFILNDNPKNIKENKQNGDNVKQTKAEDSQAIILTVYFPDGSFEKSLMYKDDDAKNCTSPRLFIKTKDAYLAFCKKSKQYKFGKFFFQ
ncbi:MAG: hypothetical protein HY958_06480 [Bacteroidia bacterium]|nr:hypothetical protein [Bacteroidia bacterium]